MPEGGGGQSCCVRSSEKSGKRLLRVLMLEYGSASRATLNGQVGIQPMAPKPVEF